MIVIADESGQLANRMFLFGHLIGFAEEHGVRVANPAFYPYSAYFRATDRDSFCRFPASARPRPAARPVRWFCYRLVALYAKRLGKYGILPGLVRVVTLDWTQKCYLNREGFVHLARQRKMVLLRGWRFRDYAGFEKHAAVIRDHFRPTAEIERNVVGLIQTCRSQADVIIGVHVRYGDYREFRGGIYYYTLDQYAAVMRSVERTFPGQRVLFLLCSNETLGVEAFEGLHTRFSTGHPVEDLYSLAQCDYVLGPPSTYSHWASFYGQVPLYVMMTADAPASRDVFRVAMGDCDLAEDMKACTEVAPA